MVYIFRIADEPDCCLGEPDRTPLHLDWFQKPSHEQDKPIEPWMREYFPTMITVVPNEHPLLDVVGSHLGMSFSERAKNLIEGLEPGVHQFLKLEVKYGAETLPYYLLRFGTTEDCYDLERSNIRWVETEVKGRTYRGWRKEHLKPMTFIRGKVAGKHLWQNASGQDMKLMSKELRDLFAENNITGLKYEEQAIVDA